VEYLEPQVEYLEPQVEYLEPQVEYLEPPLHANPMNETPDKTGGYERLWA